MSARVASRRRALVTVLARRTAQVRSRRSLLVGIGRALLLTLVAALAAAPFSVAWGVGHAETVDYLGPNRAVFATNFTGEIELDLGPIGNAYLESPVKPIGVEVVVGGVGSAGTTLTSLFSEQTLAEYANLYAEPQEAVAGVVERLEVAALRKAVEVEALLLLLFAAWRLRRGLLAPWVAERLTRRRALIVYVTVVSVVVGSILAPSQSTGTRIGVAIANGTRFESMRVDSVLLADLLDRGVKGVRLLSGRQQAAVATYVSTATASLARQERNRPKPLLGETMLLGFSDLHCNQAMTQLIKILAGATQPSVLLSSGDDTVNGTAVERGCVKREAAIGTGQPFLVATGNHDSNVTEAQMKSDGMTVLDGAVVQAAGLEVLGDDDPERQIPFTIERTRDRAETEEEMGRRLVDLAAKRRTDVILVHQPAAADVIMATPNLPARLVLWGHFHSQAGPFVKMHEDGSWSVGMQEGTAGGVRQPTLTSFSTPFSPPLISADVYFYFRDDATGLITGVQPVHFLPDAKVVIDQRIPTGNLAELPVETRLRLGGGSTPAAPTPTPGPTPTG